MTDLRRAAEMALEALESFKFTQNPLVPQSIYVLRQALAQPEQEPTNTIETVCALLRQAHDVLSLSSLPPKREWVSLTDEECDEIWGECLGVFDCLKMTEAKLKEKNI